MAIHKDNIGCMTTEGGPHISQMDTAEVVGLGGTTSELVQTTLGW